MPAVCRYRCLAGRHGFRLAISAVESPTSRNRALRQPDQRAAPGGLAKAQGTDQVGRARSRAGRSSRGGRKARAGYDGAVRREQGL